MGYVRRVRFASFFAGAALASAVGLYFLQKDYMVGHQTISQQWCKLGSIPKQSWLTFEEPIQSVVLNFDDAPLRKTSCPKFLPSKAMSSLYKSMDERISALEKLKQAEAPKGGEAAE